MIIKKILLAGSLVLPFILAHAQDEMWDKIASGKEHPNIQWFKEAKFGLFVHWGLYSKLGGVWQGKRYYGSGEWIMNQAKIPAAAYAAEAGSFNPVHFNADEWASLAKEAGIKYMVVTAKHHEGFAMYDSKVSDFTIVKSTPYKKDPMKALAEATRKQGIPFGFYYSQFLDWHEPNGGGNRWDFKEDQKDYLRYYREKSIPQLKELLTQYGPLGIVWFDMPGGLTKQQTQALVDSMRRLQPNSLFSSRVGQGLGDYRDFGDSEVPPEPIKEVWESIYTHNDSWGYISHDMNFKSPAEIIRLLANVASKGGNLMLNVGPDGEGRIPYYSVQYLKAVGQWLRLNGESIYGTTYGFVPAQPWGVTTAKRSKLYLHVLDRPAGGKLLVPGCAVTVTKAYTLVGKRALRFTKTGNDVVVELPAPESHSVNTVIVLEYTGKPPAYDAQAPVTVSAGYANNTIEAIHARTYDSARVKSLTYSHYFGDWKHAVCVTNMQSPGDSVMFTVRVTDAADYKVLLEYACAPDNAKQEASVTVDGATYLFRTLPTAAFDKHAPMQFIQHPVAIVTIRKPGVYTIVLKPLEKGKELMMLRSMVLEAIRGVSR